MSLAAQLVLWGLPTPRVPASELCQFLILSKPSGYQGPGPIEMCPLTVRAFMLLRQVRAPRWCSYMAFRPIGGLGEGR